MGWLTPRVWSKTIWGMNCGIVDRGSAVIPDWSEPAARASAAAAAARAAPAALACASAWLATCGGRWPAGRRPDSALATAVLTPASIDWICGVDRGHGPVEERAGAVDDLGRLVPRQLPARAARAAVGRCGRRRRREATAALVLGDHVLAGEAGLELGERGQILGLHQVGQRLVDQDDHRVGAEVALVVIGRLVAGRGRADERVDPGRGLADRATAAPPPMASDERRSPIVSAGRRAAAAASRSSLSFTVIARVRLAAWPGRPVRRSRDRAVRRRAAAQSIVSGPWDSPERNWRMNGFSELSMSSAGPASTIRPFHRTLM